MRFGKNLQLNKSYFQPIPNPTNKMLLIDESCLPTIYHLKRAHNFLYFWKTHVLAPIIVLRTFTGTFYTKHLNGYLINIEPDSGNYVFRLYHIRHRIKRAKQRLDHFRIDFGWNMHRV